MRRRRSSSGCFFVLAFAFAMWSVPHVAWASPTSRLVYVRGPGAEGCPDEAAMRSAVAARLGYDPFRVVATTTLSAQISRENGLYRGQIKLVDDSGVERGARSLESRADDCGELTQALALSMSIAIDPLSVLSPPKPKDPEPTPPEPKPPEPPPSPLVTARPAPPPVPPPPPPPVKGSEGPRLALAASGHGSFGVGPAPAFGLVLSSELVWSNASLGAGVRLDFPSGVTTAQGGRVRATFVGGEVVPCLRFPLGKRTDARYLTVAGCGLVLLGGVLAESTDVSGPRSSGTVFAGAGLRLGLDLPLVASFSARLSGDLLGHFTPYGLAVNGATVFSSSPFSGRIGLGLVRFF
jgi:hypothetical protein